MQQVICICLFFLTVAVVIVRVRMMRRAGIRAMKFGATNRSDFLLPPFVLFYVYLIVFAAFGVPIVPGRALFHSAGFGWVGVGLCAAGLALFVATVVSFGKSFRVGIDADHPDELVTGGVFAFSRNPIYVAFMTVFAGEFFAYPNWILLLYFVGLCALIHRQVLREEAFLQSHYGAAYEAYRERVRRYL